MMNWKVLMGIGIGLSAVGTGVGVASGICINKAMHEGFGNDTLNAMNNAAIQSSMAAQSAIKAANVAVQMADKVSEMTHSKE